MTIGNFLSIRQKMNWSACPLAALWDGAVDPGKQASNVPQAKFKEGKTASIERRTMNDYESDPSSPMDGISPMHEDHEEHASVTRSTKRRCMVGTIFL